MRFLFLSGTTGDAAHRSSTRRDTRVPLASTDTRHSSQSAPPRRAKSARTVYVAPRAPRRHTHETRARHCTGHRACTHTCHVTRQYTVPLTDCSGVRLYTVYVHADTRIQHACASYCGALFRVSIARANSTGVLFQTTFSTTSSQTYMHDGVEHPRDSSRLCNRAQKNVAFIALRTRLAEI